MQPLDFVSKCVQCGKCLEVCPLLRATNREELSPRAKSILMSAGSEYSCRQLATLCLACGRCSKVCPQGVTIPQAVAQLRSRKPDFYRFLWKIWTGPAKKLWDKAPLAEKIVPKRGQLGLMTKGLCAMDGKSRLHPVLTPVFPKHPAERGNVLLFSGCVGTYVMKSWQENALRLLHGMGFNVLNPCGRFQRDSFTCCGSTHGSAGLPEQQQQARRQNVHLWRQAGYPVIVVYCATCQKELTAYFVQDDPLQDGLFESEEEAKAFAQSVTPLAQLLPEVEFVLSEDVPSKIHYHRPCHMAEKDKDAALLKRALGTHYGKENVRECCGFGGIMQLAAPDISQKVAARCWDAFVADGRSEKGPQWVVTGCSGCALQLRANTVEGFSAGHWLELMG